MAKNALTPEEAAFQELMKKVLDANDTCRQKEKSKKVIQVGKEMAMFLCWLQEVTNAPLITEDNIRIWIAQLLEDYPEELKKVLVYYDNLKGFSTKWNFKGFSCEYDCLDKGALWLSIKWEDMNPPTELLNNKGEV